MVDYDSDSSDNADVETGVTLGYTSNDSTGDDFSQLGGQPIWLNGLAPSGALAKCKVCNGLLNLLLQLHGDLPERFAGHERRLYLFGCRYKACRRKEGSIRGLRFSKIDAVTASKKAVEKPEENTTTPSAPAAPASTLGNTLFGVAGSTSSASANPFAPKSPVSAGNPFASKPAMPVVTELSQTFAEKARIAADTPAKPTQGAIEPWPAVDSFPKAYPSYYIDADKEFLDPEPAEIPQQTRVVDLDDDAGGSGSTADDKSAFESTMDKTFQKFADRLAQNPEQVLRYEYGGQPLLYAKKDTVGKTWPRIPRCTKCGGQRQFELQLTPHAITELEADDISLEGMEWGTIILAVCGNDCEGWNEEWVGVQYEEMAGRKPA